MIFLSQAMAQVSPTMLSIFGGVGAGILGLLGRMMARQAKQFDDANKENMAQGKTLAALTASLNAQTKLAVAQHQEIRERLGGLGKGEGCEWNAEQVSRSDRSAFKSLGENQ